MSRSVVAGAVGLLTVGLTLAGCTSSSTTVASVSAASSVTPTAASTGSPDAARLTEAELDEVAANPSGAVGRSFSVTGIAAARTSGAAVPATVCAEYGVVAGPRCHQAQLVPGSDVDLSILTAGVGFDASVTVASASGLTLTVDHVTTVASTD